MKALIFGGAGFVGRNLTEELMSSGYQVCIVTRNSQNIAGSIRNKVQLIEWDRNNLLSSVKDEQKINLQEFKVVVNLAGESIGNRRWTNSVKQEILESRIRTTHAIVSAINNGTLQPNVLINASAVGYYGPRQDEEITEIEGAGQDFLAQICRDWENEAYKVQNNLARVVTMRIGVVLGDEGALNRMVLPFKFYMGGSMGSGNQWLSWIHIHDLTRMIRFAIEQPEVVGPVNATAPGSTRMKDFAQVLGDVLRRPSWFPVPEFLLKIALGQMSEMLLHGQQAVPKKLLEAGFVFRFPELRSALLDILDDADQ